MISFVSMLICSFIQQIFTEHSQCAKYSQRTDAFELGRWRRLLRFPWTARRYNQSILKEISPEYSLEGMMLKAETPTLWPPNAKCWLIWKDPDAGKDWSQEEKGTTEDEMVGWHHQLNGHELEYFTKLKENTQFTRVFDFSSTSLLIFVWIQITTWKYLNDCL